MELSGFDISVIRTVIFLQIALFELTIVWNTRSETRSVFKIGFGGNKWLVIAVLISVVSTIAVVYIPGSGPDYSFPADRCANHTALRPAGRIDRYS